MKLLVRFNLLFVVIFASGIAVSVLLANAFLEREAEDRVRAQAELMVETASATRLYAEEQIKPLMSKLQKRDANFLPQSVPTYSAIQVFKKLHQLNRQYAYKDAMLNPPARAPATMVRDYGPNNEFGWRLNEVVGAQFVSVPESLPIRMAHNA